MSLRDIDNEEEAEELSSSRKRRGHGIKVPKNIKLGIVLVIAGVIIGLLAGHYYVEPMLDSINNGSYTQCLAAKDILTKENDCLYNYINDAKMVVDGCSS